MTAAALPTPATRRLLAADRLRTGSAVVLAFLPLGMALANRSAPLLITLSALLALAATLAEGEGAAVAERLRDVLRTPLGLAAASFLAFAVASLAWSPRPDLSLHALGEFALSLGAALLLALTLADRMPRAAPLFLLAGVAAACAVILADLATDLWARHWLGLRAGSYIHNRPALTLLVLTPALLAALPARPERSAASRTALAVAALAALTILATDSAAAALGLACGGLAFAAARSVPRLALGLAAGCVALSILLAPTVGDLAARLAPPSLHERLEGAHSAERVDVWRSFGAAVREAPLIGSGFGVSPRLHETAVADAVPPDRRTLLAVGHPHNAALQIWVELGLLGAALALAVALLVLRNLAALPPQRLAPALALFASVAAVSLVGHGAWQGWWPAAIGAAFVWLKAAAARGERAA
jgi:O-antigen ligase